MRPGYSGHMGRCAVLLFVAALAWAQGERLEDTLYIPLDSPAIRYTQDPNDPVARLEKRLEAGEAKLDYAGDGLGYLPSVLRLLGINADSQALVFSKTSIQLKHIAPRTPRA